MHDNVKSAVLANARSAGLRWARDRASAEQLRVGDFPAGLLANLVSWPVTLDDVTAVFKEGARQGMALRTLPDVQLPGQPPKPFEPEW